MSKLKVQRKFKEQMTKKNGGEWNVEHWNIGLTILPGFSCTIPSFHHSRIFLSSFGHFDIPLTFGF